MKMKFTRRQVVIVLAIAALVYFMTLNVKSTKSAYTVNEEEVGAFGPATGPSEAGCEMKAGTGLASSLLPREVAPQEDFGEFAPDDILAGQSFLNLANKLATQRPRWRASQREPTNPRRPTSRQEVLCVVQ